MVVHLPTWKTWRIDASAGNGLAGDGYTLTSTHLYFAEYDGLGADNSAYADRMIRWDLKQLDALTKKP